MHFQISLESLLDSVTTKYPSELTSPNEILIWLVKKGVITPCPSYNDDDLLNLNQFSNYIGRKPETLQKIRKSDPKHLPKELGDGERLILYRKRDIDQWLENNPHMQEV